eukprot:scaffold679084_cov57-Prasinocladus_malaysianus.AAC.1
MNVQEFKEFFEKVAKQPALGTEESGLRGQLTRVENEQQGEHRISLFVKLMRSLVEVKLDEALKSTKSDDHGLLEDNIVTLQQVLKVMFGWNALVEDDHRVFGHMLDPEAPSAL